MSPHEVHLTTPLQLFGELEGLKRQLAALNNLEGDLDAAEAVLNAADGDGPGALHLNLKS